MDKEIKVALIGNPNTGKTSLFNSLTGLNQKVGNYPGVTVEKKQGKCTLSNTARIQIIDLPGTYSLNASSMDENVVIDLLMNNENVDFPDIAVVVSDVENLKRNLLLFTQIKDLQIPAVLVINMSDRMPLKGIKLDVSILEEKLKTKIALISTRKNTGIDSLKNIIENYQELNTEPCLNASSEIDSIFFENLKKIAPSQNLYKLWLFISQDVYNSDPVLKDKLLHFKIDSNIDIKRLQQKDTIKRYQFINKVLELGQSIDLKEAKDIRIKLDRILTNKIWGYLIFFSILLLIFQAIYDWSTIPMDFIDNTFVKLGVWTKQSLPPGDFTNLISDGVIPGIGGIVIFIPQIVFLFLFISILEETGYMSRVVLIMDRIMRKFGLSGKSVVPLISGTACAIPAIMATRNIENWKERLITILVTPFTTCSARLPVYLILIALVIPQGSLLGFSYQALTLMLLYLIGFGMAIFSAYVLNKILKIKSKTYFVVEMPNYKMPIIKNVIITVIEKTKAFIYGAGKIILAFSIILWFLASYGPGESFNDADKIVVKQYAFQDVSADFLEQRVASFKLEHSYIGIAGRAFEPVISPLGYDWKIGIAILSSFAAREIFVGTLATIYSVNSDEEDTIKEMMSKEINPITNQPMYNIASGFSLLLFYAFAMQCMSTIAIVKKETNSWKWPIIQFTVMTAFAYIVALCTYQFII